MDITKKLILIENKITDFVLNYDENHYKDHDIGVLSGNGGFVLILAEKYLITKDEKYLQKIINIIEHINKSIIESSNISTTFCSGISGYVYLLSYLKEKNIVSLSFNDYIKHLLNKILISINNENLIGFDFLHGRIGMGIALAKHLSYRKSKDGILTIIDYLEDKSEVDSNGRKWNSLIRVDLNTYGYNLSISHGQASIISFLSRIYQLEINTVRVKKMLDESIDFIINNKFENKISLFPPWIDEFPTQESRIAWCYGDLGVGIALYNSAKILNDKKSEEFAINIFIHNAKRRDPIIEGVYDACLCHGCSGIALIYYRMYINTKIELFHETYLFWCRIAIQMQRKGYGIAGLQAFDKKEGEAIHYYDDYSLLNGITGIGLALNSIIHNTIPEWDRFLLLS